MKKLLLILMIVSAVNAWVTYTDRYLPIEELKISDFDGDFVDDSASVGATEFDSINVRHGIRSTRTITSTGSYAQISLVLDTIDLSGYDFFRLVTFDGGNMSDIALCSITFYTRSPNCYYRAFWDAGRIKYHGWADGYITKNDMTVTDVSGVYDPDWRYVTKIIIKITAKPGKTITTTFDYLSAFKTKLNKGIAMFTFDEGIQSQYDNAVPKMISNGMHGTYFIVTKNVDVPGNFTLANLTYMQNNGQCISSHSVNNVNLTTISPDSAEYELRESYNFLKNNNFKGANLFAYPSGACNDTVISLANKYYSFSRSTNGSTSYDLNESTPFLEPYALKSIIIRATTTLSTAKSYIDSCVTQKVPMIFVFHGIVNSGAVDYEWNKSDFDSLCDYAKTYIDAGTLLSENMSEYFLVVDTTKYVVFRQSTDTLKLVCSAENALTYQWYDNNVAVTGATDSVYTIYADSAFYSIKHVIYCLTSNSSGSLHYGDWTIKNKQIAFRRKY